MARQREQAFDRFIRDAEPRLRRALVAAYGPEAGREATVDALGWAWTHWDRVEEMTNPVGYLYRVGQTEARRGRRLHRSSIEVEPPSQSNLPWVEPALEPALAALTETGSPPSWWLTPTSTN